MRNKRLVTITRSQCRLIIRCISMSFEHLNVKECRAAGDIVDWLQLLMGEKL